MTRWHVDCTVWRIMLNARLYAGCALTIAAAITSTITGCGDDSKGIDPAKQDREEGQTEFQSAPPAGQTNGGGFSGSSSSGGGGDNAGAPSSSESGGVRTDTVSQAKPQETDIYRVDGDRLYFLNAYRGLLVFDVSNVDDPKLLGRSAVFGTPVEMFVKNGIATVVVGDWYGTTNLGTPFHGSVVQTLDARDPANIQKLGEVQVKGWARDMRVVGNNLFVVSEDYGWYYGMWGGYYGNGGGMATDGIGYGGYGYGGSSKVVISSINFGDHAPKLNGEKEFDGYSGAFNVTSTAIIMAHDVLAEGPNQYKQPTGKSSVDFIGFSPFDGSILQQGSFQVDGLLNGWSADNGRWNIDFDGKTASVLTCASSDYGYCNGGQGGYNLTTIDFTNADAPALLGKINIANKGWAATARFDNKRMYLSPREGVWDQNGQQQQATPIEIYDLSTPATPKLAGSTNITGAVWLFMPVGTDRLFALGNEYGNGYSSSKVALRWIDVGDATQPKVLGTSTFGDGWAWTPAAGTFKAFTRDDANKLVVLPFSGWNHNSYEYTNGVQLIEYDTGSVTTKGAAKSKGWVERGVFVKNRLVSLSDQALSVVDYGDRNNPKVVKEMTLARNVIAAQPDGASQTIAQLSTDWWGYDNQQSELRVLPLSNAEETTSTPAAQVNIKGADARIFRNGNLAYVVSTVYPKQNSGGPWHATPHVQVVDLSNGGAVLKGELDLPDEDGGYYYGWWGGCFYYDWYYGSNAVQVGNDALAFRRQRGSYDSTTGKYTWDSKLYVVDLSNADAPKLTSTTITTDPDSWWGNMRVVGNTLYTTHYDYVQKPTIDPNNPNQHYWVRYYLDQIDLSDRANPKVGQRINVPGLLVGASEADPSLLYFIDYRWYENYNQGPKDEFSVARIKDGKAYLKSNTLIDGWVGNVFVRGNKAYTSAEKYTQGDGTAANPGKSTVSLHEIDFTDPKAPVVRTSQAKDGWGWLVGVEGDRAIITSGWGQVGLDIYKLQDGQAPVFSQFARTRGWWTNAMTRQDDALFLSSGYWGVQRINLK